MPIVKWDAEAAEAAEAAVRLRVAAPLVGFGQIELVDVVFFGRVHGNFSRSHESQMPYQERSPPAQLTLGVTGPPPNTPRNRSNSLRLRFTPLFNTFNTFRRHIPCLHSAASCLGGPK